MVTFRRWVIEILSLKDLINCLEWWSLCGTESSQQPSGNELISPRCLQLFRFNWWVICYTSCQDILEGENSSWGWNANHKQQHLSNRFSFNMNDCLSWSCIEFVAFADALHSIACSLSLIDIATMRYSSFIWFYRYTNIQQGWTYYAAYETMTICHRKQAPISIKILQWNTNGSNSSLRPRLHYGEGPWSWKCWEPSKHIQRPPSYI